MTSSDRESTGAVRSLHVATFLPPDWARVARLAVPALERLTPGAGTQLLLLTPDAEATLGLARALATLPAAAGRRVVAATSAARAIRLLAPGAPDVVIGSAAALAPSLAATALKLGTVTQVGFVGADEWDEEDEAVAALLAEVPKTAARWLTALEPTAGVEALLARYLHKARRVLDDVAPAADATPAPMPVRVLRSGGAMPEALQTVLDEVDPPSAAILAADPALTDAVRRHLAAVGDAGGALAQVVDAAVPANVALVVLVGVPTASTWAAVVEARPAQVVAILPGRQRAALQRLVGETPLLPFAAQGAGARARAAEARRRAELRAVLEAGVPAREVLALEPLLDAFDGLEVAAAALRLLERARAGQAEAVRAAEERAREAAREAARDVARAGGEAGASPRDRGTGPRGPRGGPRGGSGDARDGRGGRGGPPGGARGGARGGPPRRDDRRDARRDDRRDGRSGARDERRPPRGGPR